MIQLKHYILTEYEDVSFSTAGKGFQRETGGRT